MKPRSDRNERHHDRFQQSIDLHGYAFQSAVQQLAAALHDAQSSDWVFKVSELPVIAGEHETRVDFVLTYLLSGFPYIRGLLVAECKRVDPEESNWLFFKSKFVRRDSDCSDVLVQQLYKAESGGAIHSSVGSLHLAGDQFHVAHAARVPKKKVLDPDERDDIERACQQVMKGLIGLASRLKSRGEDRIPIGTHIPLVPVLFTTATLWEVTKDLSSADPRTGRLLTTAEDFKERNWVWLRYHASESIMRTAALPHLAGYGPPTVCLERDLDFLNARSIAVVGPSGVEEFLNAAFWRENFDA